MALAHLFFPALMFLAAFSDLLSMRISNKLVLVLALGFLALALLASMPPAQMAMHVLGGGVVLAGAFGMFAMGWVGGGDAKLAAATALWLGWGAGILHYLVYAALLGGVLTVLILILRSLPLNPYLAGQAWLARLHDRKSGVPYGIALAFAGVLVYPHSAIFSLFSA